MVVSGHRLASWEVQVVWAELVCWVLAVAWKDLLPMGQSRQELCERQQKDPPLRVLNKQGHHQLFLLGLEEQPLSRVLVSQARALVVGDA